MYVPSSLLPYGYWGFGFRFEYCPISCFPDVPEQESDRQEPCTVDHCILVRFFQLVCYAVYNVIVVSVMAFKQPEVAFPQGVADWTMVHQMFHCLFLAVAECTAGWTLTPFPLDLVLGKHSTVQ